MSRFNLTLLSLVLVACGAKPQASQPLTGEEAASATPPPVVEGSPIKQDHRDFTLAAKAELNNWLISELPRGRETSQGDRSLGIPRVSNHLPSKNSNGYLAAICAGAGCPLKIPYQFTGGHIAKVSEEMAQARTAANCVAETPECERVALSRAMVVMEMMVHDESLKPMSVAEQVAHSTAGTYEARKQLIQDCVDQATNGISYLTILAEENLLRHHQIIHPGRINIAIIQPHYFTQIKSQGGTVYRFDLYHRGRFGIPPYIAPQN